MLACGYVLNMSTVEVTSDSTGKRVLDKEPLQIRIPRDVKRRFKAEAAMLGIEPNELFVRIWSRYERSKNDPI